MGRRKLVLALAVIVFLCKSLLYADPVEVQVLEKEVIANITVAGIYQLTLTITFEDVTGLDQNSLNITATQVDPTNLTLLARLGGSSLISIPTQLPVLINVTPSPGSTLTFSGTTDVDVSTSNLSFQPSLRLFKAPNGGAFEDITSFSGIGSYRVRGTSGEFSDFIIAADLGNNPDVINRKFDLLQSTLNAHASRIQPNTLQNLQANLNTARASYNGGSSSQAASILDSMISDIKADSGHDIPNTYRANDPASVNVAGILRSQAATLIFSLRL